MSKLPMNRLVSLLQKRFFSTKNLHKPPQTTPEAPSSTTHVPKPKSHSLVTPRPLSSSFTVEYLVKSCGVPLKSAISAAKKVDLEKKKKPQYDSVVDFLKSHEFSDTHVAKLLEKMPAVLCCRISSNLEPKIKFLAENGVPGSIVPRVIVSNPSILYRSLDSQLKPVMEFLKEYVWCNDKLLVIIDRGSWILTCDFKSGLQRNMEFLIEQGVPKNRVVELLVLQPRVFYFQDPERMTYGVNMVRSFGIKPTARNFIHTLRVILSLSHSTWERKVEVFKSLGWSLDEIISTLVRSPLCFSCSEDKLRDIMDFLVNTVKLDPKIVIGYPKLLMYSLKKRMIPRYTVWKILRERELLSGSIFVWLLNKSEEIFVNEYIVKFSNEIPHLRCIYDKSKKLQSVLA